jgi:SpoVK/Ycf46/Vps4 family AAA+-type ATPase
LAFPGPNATTEDISNVIESMNEQEKQVLVEEIDFDVARKNLAPSISPEELERYKSIREKFE